MSKRKKRKLADLNALKKVAEAQHKKEFFRRLRVICDRLTETSFYPKITKEHLELIYSWRIKPVKIIATEGENPARELLKDMNVVLVHVIHDDMLAIDAAGHEVSLFDYFTVAFPLQIFAERIFKNGEPVNEEVKRGLEGVCSFLEQSHEFMINKIMRCMDILCFTFSDFEAGLVFMRLEVRGPEAVENRNVIIIKLSHREFERSSVVLDGHSRSLLRVGWGIYEPKAEMKYLAISDAVLPGKKNGGKEFPVYLQSHTLLRLQERIDGMVPGLLHYYVYFSLLNPVSCRNKNGDLLIELRISDNKAGYFVAEVADEKLILRTFLFLTHTGTPEGDRLQETTGLRMEDKKYLAIDKLSSFMGDDIRSNEKVKKIFVDAGCGSLFEMDDKMMSPGAIKSSTNAALIEKYLGMNEKEYEVAGKK